MSSSLNLIKQAISLNQPLLQAWSTASRKEFRWFQIPLRDDQSCEFEVEIANSKIGNFSDQRSEFVWHKNINLPSISIKSLYDNEFNLSLSCSCLSLRGLKTSQIKRVGLTGGNMIPFKDEKAIFNRLRFEETSHSHKQNEDGGGQFYLSFFITSKKSGTLEELPIALIISSSLHIESRKKPFQQRSSRGSLLDPFLPNFLFKKLIVIRPERGQTIEIEDTEESLFDYLTAQNIRHKVCDWQAHCFPFESKLYLA